MPKNGQVIAIHRRNIAALIVPPRPVAAKSKRASMRPGGGATRYGARGAMGYLSHNTSLYPDLTALENLRFYARLMDMSDDDSFLVQRIEEVGLAGRELEPVRNYSRGMQQRLAFARAFLHNPGILLLDEPFTGLDQAGSDFLQRYLLKARSDGKVCIMAIHDMGMGYEVADRLVVIEKGVAALDVPKASISLVAFSGGV